MNPENFELLSIDFEKEAYQSIPLPELTDLKDEEEWSGRTGIHLINLRGSLAVVDVAHDLFTEEKKIEIWAMKSYRTPVWEKKYRIAMQLNLFRGRSLLSLSQLNDCPGSLGVWEHGPVFTDVLAKSKNVFYVLRLNDGHIRTVKVRSASMRKNYGYELNPLNIFSYSGSLMSLRNFCGNNLIEAAEKKTSDDQRNLNLFTAGKMERSMLPRFAVALPPLDHQIISCLNS